MLISELFDSQVPSTGSSSWCYSSPFWSARGPLQVYYLICIDNIFIQHIWIIIPRWIIWDAISPTVNHLLGLIEHILLFQRVGSITNKTCLRKKGIKRTDVLQRFGILRSGRVLDTMGGEGEKTRMLDTSQKE